MSCCASVSSLVTKRLRIFDVGNWLLDNCKEREKNILLKNCFGNSSAIISSASTSVKRNICPHSSTTTIITYTDVIHLWKRNGKKRKFSYSNRWKWLFWANNEAPILLCGASFLFFACYYFIKIHFFRTSMNRRERMGGRYGRGGSKYFIEMWQ